MNAENIRIYELQALHKMTLISFEHIQNSLSTIILACKLATPTNKDG
jgi:hypothetical protein